MTIDDREDELRVLYEESKGTKKYNDRRALPIHPLDRQKVKEQLKPRVLMNPWELPGRSRNSTFEQIMYNTDKDELLKNAGQATTTTTTTTQQQAKPQAPPKKEAGDAAKKAAAPEKKEQKQDKGPIWH